MQAFNRIKKKLYTVIAFMAIAAFAAGCGSTGTTQSTAATANDEIAIVYTNDVHTYIDNKEVADDGTETELLTYGKVAAIRDDLKADGSDVMLVDVGDFLQGTPYGSIDHGASIVQIINAIGYDINVIGNHDFDYGLDVLKSYVKDLKSEVISCNFINKTDNKPVFDRYTIKELGGKKVAFIGITTPETIYSSSPKHFSDEQGNLLYTFGEADTGENFYSIVQETIDEARSKADYVIALGHLGVETGAAPYRSIDLIANVTGLDAFIDGHSHTEIEKEYHKDKDGKDVLLTQTGYQLNAVGVLTINDGKIDSRLIKEYDHSNEDVATLTGKIISNINSTLSKSIAVTDIDLLVNDANDPSLRLVRNTETNLGDFCADAMYYHFNNVENINCDIAIMQGGGVRTNILSGDINFFALKNVQPFANVACLVEVPGKVIQDMFEWSTLGCSPDPATGKLGENGGFLQVAGAKYTYNSSIENTCVKDDNNQWISGPTGTPKVSDIQIYNRETGKYEPLDLNKTYTVAGQKYILAENGNGYTMFNGCKLLRESASEDASILAEYMESFTKGSDGLSHINTANSPLKALDGFQLDYDNPLGAGRITVVGE